MTREPEDEPRGDPTRSLFWSRFVSAILTRQYARHCAGILEPDGIVVVHARRKAR